MWNKIMTWTQVDYIIEKLKKYPKLQIVVLLSTVIISGVFVYRAGYIIGSIIGDLMNLLI